MSNRSEFISWRNARIFFLAAAFLGASLVAYLELTTSKLPIRAVPHVDSLPPCPAASSDSEAPAHCRPFENLCSGYRMETTRSGYAKYQNQLPEAVLAGTRFPRTDRLQYRGIRDDQDQFTVAKVLRAIGGDPTLSIGSSIHWLAESVLSVPDRLFKTATLMERLRRSYRWYVLGLPAMFGDVDRVFATHGILDNVHRLLECAPAFAPRDAAVYAEDLARKAVNHLEDKWGEHFSRHAFAYSTEEFRLYGDYKGPIHLYSTSYPLMAHSYGPKVLVFANRDSETLDLNYWNFVKNDGIWTDHNADRAEFVTAVGIDPENVVGLWKTDHAYRDEMGRDTSMHSRTLRYALMRMEYQDAAYAVILDASSSGCVVQVDRHFEGCEPRIPGRWEPADISSVDDVEFGALVPNGSAIPVIAAVRACAVTDTACNIPKAVFAQMPLSKRRLSKKEIAEIAAAGFVHEGRTYEQNYRHAIE